MPLIGLLALLWFLLRVIPKPSRAAYPCQRAALSTAGLSLWWLVTPMLSALGLGQARRLRDRRPLLSRLLTALAIGGVILTIGLIPGTTRATPNQDPANSPIGTPRGIYPGRVAWVHDPAATTWNGPGYWWQDSNTNQGVVDSMMNKVVRWVAGEQTVAAAWQAIFSHFNLKQGKGSVGYQAGEKIAIKVNLNCAWDGYGEQDNQIDASPHTTIALLDQLVNVVGVSQQSITVYDAARQMPNWFFNKVHGAFPNVRYVDSDGAGARIQRTWVYNQVDWSDGHEDSALPQSVVEADYLINVALLKVHGLAAVTLGAKNHFGTIDDPWNQHDLIEAYKGGMADYDPHVDLMAHQHLGEKTLLFMIDGLYGAPDLGAEPTKWSMAPFNNHWPSSLFASLDGVALDSVGFDFLWEEFQGVWPPGWVNGDRYLHEAALIGNAPSGTVYDPDNNGPPAASLGVHEHWNNATSKQYAGNMGSPLGIELISSEPVVAGDPAVSISATDPDAAELGADTATLTVARAGNTSQPLEVDFVLGGSASEGTDYEPIGTSLTIAAGQSSAALVLTPLSDDLVEGNETVSVTLVAGQGYELGQPASAVATITDNPPNSNEGGGGVGGGSVGGGSVGGGSSSGSSGGDGAGGQGKEVAAGDDAAGCSCHLVHSPDEEPHLEPWWLFVAALLLGYGRRRSAFPHTS